MVKRLTDKAKHNFVMFLADDTMPEYGFLPRAMRHMDALPGGWGLVGLNDGLNGSESLATHWLASKELLDYLENREFFFTGYKHTQCDLELTDKAKALGRYIYADDARIKHNHPFKEDLPLDADYERIYSNPVQLHDRKLYLTRRKADGYRKLGIGFPITDMESLYKFSCILDFNAKA